MEFVKKWKQTEGEIGPYLTFFLWILKMAQGFHEIQAYLHFQLGNIPEFGQPSIGLSKVLIKCTSV